MATRIAIVPGLDKSIGLGIVRRLAKELPDEISILLTARDEVSGQNRGQLVV